MTRGTSLIVFRSGLLTRLQARTALAAVQVAYEKPRTELGPEAIWFDNEAEADTELPVMMAGEKDVDETYTVGMVIQVLVGDGSTQLVADQRAVVLLAEVQKELAETPRTIDAIEWVELAAWAYVGGPIGENGGQSAARFGITLRVHARLYGDQD